MSKTIILTPVYVPNESHLTYLSESLRSTCRLSDDFIHWVIDDGSPIDTAQVVCSFDDERFRYHRRKRKEGDNETASNVLNYGVNAILDRTSPYVSQNEYSDISSVTVLSYDDLMIDLAKRREALYELGIDGVVSDLITFQEMDYARRKTVKTTNPYHYISSGRIRGLNHITVLLKLQFVREMREFNFRSRGVCGIFPPNVCYGEDRAAAKLMVYVAAMQQKQIGYVPHPSILIRRHPTSLCGRLSGDTIERDRRFVDGLYFPTRCNPVKNLRLLRYIYLNIIKPHKHRFRTLMGQFTDNRDLDLVRSFLKEIRSS